MNTNFHAKRSLYLVHRWTGIAGCALLLLWFISGMVMLFVGYPKLTPWERLGAMPPLIVAPEALRPDQLPGQPLRHGHEVVLNSVEGARFVVGPAAAPLALGAETGLVADATRQGAALAAARAFMPGSELRYRGLVEEDRWTHSRQLDVHRPLHRVEAGGPRPTTLYVSSRTGHVVLDAPWSQQRWNALGAWLHWLYVFRSTSTDPVWTWIVIGLSTVCTVTALSGLVIGVWRWRFRGRYKSGSRSPYRESWMRWHHLLGLSGGLLACAWIFSGLMSMNPLGVFSARSVGPDVLAYQGAASNPPAPLASPQGVLQALALQDFQAVELQWRRLSGEHYVLAYDQQAQSRLVREREGLLEVTQHWPSDDIVRAAALLFTETTWQWQLLEEHDAYYYSRHAEAMNGALPRSLPALRLSFEDPGHHLVYIDLATGQVAVSLARRQQLGRWLFYFLHSWDTPWLLRWGLVRDLVIVFFSLVGVALATTGMVLGWRRLRRHSV